MSTGASVEAPVCNTAYLIFVCVYVCDVTCVYVCDVTCVYACDVTCVYVCVFVCLFQAQFLPIQFLLSQPLPVFSEVAQAK